MQHVYFEQISGRAWQLKKTSRSVQLQLDCSRNNCTSGLPSYDASPVYCALYRRANNEKYEFVRNVCFEIVSKSESKAKKTQGRTIVRMLSKMMNDLLFFSFSGLACSGLTLLSSWMMRTSMRWQFAKWKYFKFFSNKNIKLNSYLKISPVQENHISSRDESLKRISSKWDISVMLHRTIHSSASSSNPLSRLFIPIRNSQDSSRLHSLDPISQLVCPFSQLVVWQIPSSTMHSIALQPSRNVQSINFNFELWKRKVKMIRLMKAKPSQTPSLMDFLNLEKEIEYWSSKSLYLFLLLSFFLSFFIPYQVFPELIVDERPWHGMVRPCQNEHWLFEVLQM